ncbi:MAG: FAD-dependent oxidoreductase [Clostridiales bacterium]|nr:FAD-dependent oxidoreductase [Clostridiales bacterium]
MRIKRMMALLLALAILGAGTAALAAGYKAGTYKASAKGMVGDVTVEVTFTDSAIASVEVVSHNETAGIGTTAVDKLPGQIVEHQSLKLDAISGATITGDAILAAVADCVQQAGGDVDALQVKEIEKVQLEDETLTADVVVVGAGVAGLSAAIEAAEAGAKVVLLEKMAAVGGASITCGGEVLAAGTQLQKDQGIEDTAEALGDLWVDAGEGKANEEYLRAIAKQNADTIEFMQKHGVVFMGVKTPTSYPWQYPMRNHQTEEGSGAGFILPMEKSARDLGVDLRTDTKATKLIQEDGQVVGVVAENAGRTVTVKAPSVVLATGGYGNNKELMDQYALPEIPNSGVRVGEANQGDGLIMARDAGAQIVGSGAGIALALDFSADYGIEPYGRYLYVDSQGNRFMDESQYWFVRTRKLYDIGGSFFLLTDKKDTHHDWEKLVVDGKASKGDTLADLAQAIGMDAAQLQKTVDTYNGWCASGVDGEFGKPAMNVDKYANKEGVEAFPLLTALDSAPFYAMKMGFNSLSGTFSGPKVTLQGEVLTAEDKVIPGLYAAGEVANGDLYYKQYPCSGSAIQLYCSMGRFAGQAAAAYAKGK